MTPSRSANCSPASIRRGTSGQRCVGLQRFIDERLPPLAEVALAASARADVARAARRAALETY
jgi:hypothetical protein